jgi:hypothetical protein
MSPQERESNTEDEVNGDYYGLTPQNDSTPRNDSTSQSTQPSESSDDFHPFADVLDSEPADPPPGEINDETRRQTRIAGEHTDVDKLPKPLVECGCGQCPERYDPLADDVDGAFGDVLDRTVYAADECDKPRPVTVERAATITRAYEIASHESHERSARIDSVRAQHGRLMDAERQLLDGWNADDGGVTTVLLSLRVSPIETVGCGEDGEDTTEESRDYYGLTSQNSMDQSQNDAVSQNEMAPETESTAELDDETARVWVPPTTLRERLADGWRKVRRRLDYHLGDYDWGYCWVIGTTDSAATPHLHIYLWIKDPDDEITLGHVEPAVEAFVDHAPGARPEDHRVTPGESDAAVVEHDPPILHVDEDTALYISGESDLRSYQPNTAGFAYLPNQRPEWAVAPLCEGFDEGEVPEDAALDGAAIAWASPKDGIGHGKPFEF